MTPQNIAVFCSSTCYDLADLRAELGAYLQANGFQIKFSEDPNSAFHVDPLDDSIQSCLNNVESSDVVICIIDRRYGGVLKHGPYAGKSATQAEVEHARGLTPPKPIFFFIRDAAFNDYQLLRDNPSAQTRWVEPHDAEDRKR